jgi:hypothetical protein
MQVIEAQSAPDLEPLDHLHNKQMRAFPRKVAMDTYAGRPTAR